MDARPGNIFLQTKVAVIEIPKFFKTEGSGEESDMYPGIEMSSPSSTVPAFLSKLWTLVGDGSCNDLICWDMRGRSFHVRNQTRFAKDILPLYFKHSNIASFIRQLNMYGFRKVVNAEQGSLMVENDDLEFQHTYFVRGQEKLLENIKRKVSAVVKSEPVKVKPDDVNLVLNDVHQLRGKQDTLSSKLDLMKRENEALWREVVSLRQKHFKQQQIVEKIIRFLMRFVGTKRPLGDMGRKGQLMIADAPVPTKLAKFSKDLSIDEVIADYDLQEPHPVSVPATVVAPQAIAATGLTSPGPVIRDVTDMENLTGEIFPELPTIQDDDQGLNDMLPLPDTSLVHINDLLENPNQPILTDLSDKPVVTRKTIDRDGVLQQVDSVESDLDSLKDLLSCGQYNFDSQALYDIFNTNPAPTLSPSILIENKGQEVVQYNPYDLMNMLELTGDSPSTELFDSSFINSGDTLHTPHVSSSDFSKQSSRFNVSAEDVD